jgi:hypothetical protein
MGLENLSRPIVPGPSRRTQLRAGERFNWAKDTEASTAASLARDAGLVGCPEYLADRAACVEVLTGGVRGLVKWPFAMELVMGRCLQESRRVLPPTLGPASIEMFSKRGLSVGRRSVRQHRIAGGARKRPFWPSRTPETTTYQNRTCGTKSIQPLLPIILFNH